MSLGVVSLSGNLFMDAGRPAFAEADAALHALRDKADHVLVDMHAEATSEKIGMGWYLDGRVTAVVGTHTHVPTADARILPGGTAYVTDVGMTGPRGGVIGVKREQAIEAMATKMPVRFETSTEDPWLNAVLITTGEEPRRAVAIRQLLEPARGHQLARGRHGGRGPATWKRRETSGTPCGLARKPCGRWKTRESRRAVPGLSRSPGLARPGAAYEGAM